MYNDRVYYKKKMLEAKKEYNKTKDQVRLRSFYPKGHPLKDRDRGKKSNADLYDQVSQFTDHMSS